MPDARLAQLVVAELQRADLQRRLEDALAELEWARALTRPIAGHWVSDAEGYVWERHAVRGYDTLTLPDAITFGIDVGTYGHPCLNTSVGFIRQDPGKGPHGGFYWRANGPLRQWRQGVTDALDLAKQRVDAALLEMSAGFLRSQPTCDCGDPEGFLSHKRECILHSLGLG